MTTDTISGASTGTRQRQSHQPSTASRRSDGSPAIRCRRRSSSAVESLKRDRIYKRTYKFTTKFKAHDEENNARIGDIVRIEETRPLSKDKHWRLVEILQRAVQVKPVAEVVAELEPELEDEER